MNTRKLFVAMAFMLSLTLYVSTSCSKSKETCVHCTAICGPDDQSKLDYCGDDAASQESSFRSSHPDCEVSCTN